MNKKNYIQKQIKDDVWKIYQSIYTMCEYSSEPTSDSQKEFIDKVGDYIYEKFGTQLSKDRLKDIFADDEKDVKTDKK